MRWPHKEEWFEESRHNTAEIFFTSLIVDTNVQHAVTHWDPNNFLNWKCLGLVKYAKKIYLEYVATKFLPEKKDEIWVNDEP